MTSAHAATPVPAGTDEVPHSPTGGPRAVLAAAVGYALDGFDLLVLAFAMGGIIAEFGLSTQQAGSLTTVTLLGAMLGGFVFGALADRYGRVRALTWSIVLFSVFTGLAALSTGYADLALYRFLAGIGIGGEFGIGMTLAAESVRADRRARATSWVGIGFQVGVLAAALGSAPILTLWGWRGLFVVGTVPALVAVVLRLRTPEPERFVHDRARRTETARGESLRLLVADGCTARLSLAMIVLTSVQNFGYFGIMTWLPNYLNTEFDLSVTGTALWTSVTVAGMMLGILVFGQVADRVGRRPAFRIFQIGAALSVLAYSTITMPGPALVGGFVVGMFANGMLGGYGALMAELYPTRARATAQNVLFNIGRAVGGFAPVAIAAVAQSHGFPFAIGMLSVIYVLAFATMWLIPERAGADLH